MCPCRSSAYHSWALRQAEQRAEDLPLDTRSPPATGRHGSSRAQGTIAPAGSLPTAAELAWRRQAAGSVPLPLASSESLALPARLQQRSRHVYKTESFSCHNLFFPTPEAFVSKQDGSV